VLLNFYKEFSGYLLKRIFIARIGGLIIGILLLELYLSTYVSVKAAITHLLLIALLIVTFRIWDDFSDRKYDYKHHPDRLPGAGNPQNINFYKLFVLCLLLFQMLIILFFGNYVKLAIYSAMLLLFSMLYLKEKWPPNMRILRNQTVLLKYPVILYLGSQSSDIYRLIISGVVLYLFISWFDIADTSNQSTSSRTWFFISILLIFEISKTIDHWRII